MLVTSRLTPQNILHPARQTPTEASAILCLKHVVKPIITQGQVSMMQQGILNTSSIIKRRKYKQAWMEIIKWFKLKPHIEWLIVIHNTLFSFFGRIFRIENISYLLIRITKYALKLFHIRIDHYGETFQYGKQLNCRLQLQHCTCMLHFDWVIKNAN